MFLFALLVLFIYLNVLREYFPQVWDRASSRLASRLQLLVYRRGFRAHQKYQQFLQHYEPTMRTWLGELVRANATTEFGVKHSFSSIRSVEDYVARVPLSGPADYEEPVERMSRGASGVLMNVPVTAYGLTSGTTGARRLIPLTAEVFGGAGRRTFAVAMARVLMGAKQTPEFFAAYAHTAMMPGDDIHLVERTPDGKIAHSISVLMMLQPRLARIFRHFIQGQTMPISLFESRIGSAAFVYIWTLFTLATPNLGWLECKFSSYCLAFFRCLEKSHQQLLRELRQGHIDPQNQLVLDGTPASCLRHIATALQRQPRTFREQRAATIEAEIARGWVAIASRVWPSLRIVTAVSGGSFRPYAEACLPFLGSEIGMPTSIIYAATEGMFGITTGSHSEFTPTETVLIELIHERDIALPNPRSIFLWQAQQGEVYETVFTTAGGLYRYRIGDLIRINSFACDRVPVFEVLGRIGNLYDVMAEKTSEFMFTEAIKIFAKKAGVTIDDFTGWPNVDSPPFYYQVFVQTREQQPFTQRENDLMDEALTEANQFYGVTRGQGRLAGAVVYALRPDAFFQFLTRRVPDGAALTQIKVPRKLPDAAARDFLLSRSLRS